MDIKTLQEKSLRISNEARELLNTITEENKADVEARFDRMMADADTFARQAEKLAEAEARARSFEEIVTEVPSQRSEDKADKAEVRDRAAIYGEYIRGNITASEARAQGIAVNSEGGFLTPESWAASVVKSMAFYGPLLSADVSDVILSNDGNTINFPTNNDTNNVGAIIAENTQVSEQDLVIGNVAVGAYKYSSKMVRIPNELLADSAYDVQALVSDRLGERLGRIMNTHATIGTGTSQPRGIVTGSSLGKTTASATAISDEELIDLFHTLDVAHRGNAKFMANDSTIAALRKLKDSNGAYLWQPALTLGAPETLLGKPLLTNNDMATIATGNTTVLFGDFKKFVVRMVNGLGIKRLDERFADYDQTAFLAFARMDSAVLDSAAIKHLKQA